jgi:hypothetical protein
MKPRLAKKKLNNKQGTENEQTVRVGCWRRTREGGKGKDPISAILSVNKG